MRKELIKTKEEVGLYLDLSVIQRIKKIAENDRRSLSNMIRIMLEEGLKKYETKEKKNE